MKIIIAAMLAAVSSSAIAGNYATCLLKNLPGLQNEAAAMAAIKLCASEYPGGINSVPQGDGRGLLSYKSGVERGIKPESQKPMTLLFELGLETAMRMREMFTLTLDQINIERRTVFLDKTKNGDSRQVPLSTVALAVLKDYLTTDSKGAVFPEFWNGDMTEAGLRKASSRLSGRWRTIARLARCEDLHFHDLRHEATSRFFERTTMSDIKIAKITGHRDPRMLMRYSNLRGSDLADELW